MNKNQPILSLCIPTYARCEILRGNLEQIQKQLDSINMDELELIVSNNCSPDNTEEVVQTFIKQGMSIRYNCNMENLGSDGNFLKCMDMAKGKYIWLLGDDDYLKEGSIAHILDCLRGKDYGLLYIDFKNPSSNGLTEYHDVNKFIRKVGRQITYMSANIFLKEIVEKVDADKYKNTCFVQIPFFLTSCLNRKNNATTDRDILLRDVGGTMPPQKYDFLEVFGKNFVSITCSILSAYPIVSEKTIGYLHKSMYVEYTGPYVYHNLIIKIKFRDSRWQYIFPYYGKKWYFYWNVFTCLHGTLKRKMHSIYKVKS